MPILLPPLDMQDHITTLLERLLSSIDDGVRLFRDAQRGVDEYRVAILQDAIRSEHQVKLGEIADITSGLTKGRRTKEQVRPRPFLRAANLRSGYLDLDEVKDIEATDREAERLKLQSGDVLLVEGSGSAHRLGDGWLWEGQVADCLHQNHVFRARPDQSVVVPRYLAWVVQSPAAKAYFRSVTKTTSGLNTINKQDVSALGVPLPPLDEQVEIVERLDKATSALAAQKQRFEGHLRDAASLRTSLLYSAIAGQINASSGSHSFSAEVFASAPCGPNGSAAELDAEHARKKPGVVAGQESS